MQHIFNFKSDAKKAKFTTTTKNTTETNQMIKMLEIVQIIKVLFGKVTREFIIEKSHDNIKVNNKWEKAKADPTTGVLDKNAYNSIINNNTHTYYCH